MMESMNSITPHARSGRVRGLAVSGATRTATMPELPTIAEAGVPGYEATTWTGIVAPAGVPKEIIARLNAEINKVIATPSLKEKFAMIGSDPASGSPEQFGEFIRKEYQNGRMSLSAPARRSTDRLESVLRVHRLQLRARTGCTMSARDCNGAIMAQSPSYRVNELAHDADVQRFDGSLAESI